MGFHIAISDLKNEVSLSVIFLNVGHSKVIRNRLHRLDLLQLTLFDEKNHLVNELLDIGNVILEFQQQLVQIDIVDQEKLDAVLQMRVDLVRLHCVL